MKVKFGGKKLERIQSSSFEAFNYCFVQNCATFRFVFVSENKQTSQNCEKKALALILFRSFHSNS